jgi:hypothetical protein
MASSCRVSYAVVDRFFRAHAAPEAPSYWLMRFVFLRGLGLLYFVAFFSLANQLLALMGSEGLLPVQVYLDRTSSEVMGLGPLGHFLNRPTLFWLDASDGMLLGACWLGVALSLVVLCGYANSLLLLALWFLYMSFIHVGQTWFSFGWEIQLLETGLLGVFLCPLLDGRPFPRTPPPQAIVWLLRWLVFRILIGAGLIKLRGDSCWQELTCLLYHYETQPIPHPLSWLLHSMPSWFHTLGVVLNHFVELVVPWFVFGPRPLRHAAGVVLVGFQVVLILTGNFAFLNHLTILPALACFDDRLWRRVLPERLVTAAGRASERARPSRAQAVSVGVWVAVVAVLSIQPVQNLLSDRQIMSTSYDPIHAVNTYGLFGSIGRHRNEVVLQGTRDREITEDTVWIDYEWKCKPGDLQKRPCLITPYHYRLDWLIWFAALSNYERHPWLIHLGWKLLHNDPGALSLLASNPFPDEPPRFVRAELYRYRFTRLGDDTDAWWTRRRLHSYMPLLSADSAPLQDFLRRYGWLP